MSSFGRRRDDRERAPDRTRSPGRASPPTARRGRAVDRRVGRSGYGWRTCPRAATRRTSRPGRGSACAGRRPGTAGLVAMVSARALNMREPTFGSSAQCGDQPPAVGGPRAAVLALDDDRRLVRRGDVVVAARVVDERLGLEDLGQLRAAGRCWVNRPHMARRVYVRLEAAPPVRRRRDRRTPPSTWRRSSRHEGPLSRRDGTCCPRPGRRARRAHRVPRCGAPVPARDRVRRCGHHRRGPARVRRGAATAWTRTTPRSSVGGGHPPPRDPSTYPAWRNVAAARVRARRPARGDRGVPRGGAARTASRTSAEIANRLGWLPRRPATRAPRAATSPGAAATRPVVHPARSSAITTIVSLTVDFSGPEGDQILDRRCCSTRSRSPRRAMAAVDRDPAPRRPPPPAVQHVRPVAGRPDRRAARTAAGGSSRSTSPARSAVARLRSRSATPSRGRRVGCDLRPVRDPVRRGAGPPAGPRPAEPRIPRPAGRPARDQHRSSGSSVGNIDNIAHIGGLVTGVVVGVLIPPSRVQTMRSMWMKPSITGGLEPAFGAQGNRAIRLVGLLFLLVAFAGLFAIGVSGTLGLSRLATALRTRPARQARPSGRRRTPPG